MLTTAGRLATLVGDMLKTYGIVMLGGALGTGLRLWVATIMTARYGESFPVGTLVVNVLGCLIIGLFSGFTGPQGAFTVSPLARQFVMVGMLGGFTTFSSFSLQTLTLVTGGDWWRAGLNVGLSVVLCLAAVAVGDMLAIALSDR
jgi:CrcB protein